ncbi:TetR/AcrR family transcriptional regulator [Agrococcus sp. 1P02AA]|uniref:TetR/AcrR family transcriptional regulator n=1 Tax=Agrococcus sp. 1P02AA TaxID=3132259 RepID=UPI0039A4CA44
MSTPDPLPALGRSARIRAAILDAAEQVFLHEGYARASMDAVAARAGASKQTVYKHFGSKEQLFVELVTSMTVTTGDPVGHEMARASDPVFETLVDHASVMLEAVLTPRILQLRRLVIGEATRFPELGRALFEHGPARAMAGIERRLRAWVEAGALPEHDVAAAAQHYNWLVMGAPLNAAMLLGDEAIPSAAALRAHARSAVAAMLRSIGADPAG